MVGALTCEVQHGPASVALPPNHLSEDTRLNERKRGPSRASAVAHQFAWVADLYPGVRDDRCNMNVKIAIELDSHTHHIQQLSAADFEYQTRCARFLQNAGWKVVPFCGREVNRDPMRCVEEVRRYLLTNKTAFGSTNGGPSPPYRLSPHTMVGPIRGGSVATLCPPWSPGPDRLIRLRHTERYDSVFASQISLARRWSPLTGSPDSINDNKTYRSRTWPSASSRWWSLAYSTSWTGQPASSARTATVAALWPRIMKTGSMRIEP